MFGTTHTSVIDATPEINGNGLALTVPLEFEVARQIEVLLEVGARLWRAHSIEHKAQGIKLRLASDQIVDKMELLGPRLWKLAYSRTAPLAADTSFLFMEFVILCISPPAHHESSFCELSTCRCLSKRV